MVIVMFNAMLVLVIGMEEIVLTRRLMLRIVTNNGDIHILYNCVFLIMYCFRFHNAQAHTSYCSRGCPSSWIGDKYCDRACKVRRESTH